MRKMHPKDIYISTLEKLIFTLIFLTSYQEALIS